MWTPIVMRTSDQRFVESRKDTTTILKGLTESKYIDGVKFSPYPGYELHTFLHPYISNIRHDEAKKREAELNMETIYKLATGLPVDKFREMCELLELEVIVKKTDAQ